MSWRMQSARCNHLNESVAWAAQTRVGVGVEYTTQYVNINEIRGHAYHFGAENRVGSELFFHRVYCVSRIIPKFYLKSPSRVYLYSLESLENCAQNTPPKTGLISVLK